VGPAKETKRFVILWVDAGSVGAGVDHHAADLAFFFDLLVAEVMEP